MQMTKYCINSETTGSVCLQSCPVSHFSNPYSIKVKAAWFTCRGHGITLSFGNRFNWLWRAFQLACNPVQSSPVSHYCFHSVHLVLVIKSYESSAFPQDQCWHHFHTAVIHYTHLLQLSFRKIIRVTNSRSVNPQENDNRSNLFKVISCFAFLLPDLSVLSSCKRASQINTIRVQHKLENRCIKVEDTKVKPYHRSAVLSYNEGKRKCSRHVKYIK